MVSNLENPSINTIELFAGAGGLALGMARAGFKHQAVLDWDNKACLTLQRNKASGVDLVRDWNIVECDIRQHEFEQYEGHVQVVAGGPPCQPFSLGGKSLGHSDDRNMFPEAIRAIREIRPMGFVFENVRGLLRKGFSNYYNYIIHQLRFPDICRRKNEEWEDHFLILKKSHANGNHDGLKYNVEYLCLNAANFGVPQRRDRVLIVGIRSDLNSGFEFPYSTHTQEALLYEKWVSGDYWERHEIPKSKRPTSPPPRLSRRIDRLSTVDSGHLGHPWRTVRDAISDLPKVDVGQTSSVVLNHFLNPGARIYLGHDGSRWDEPAKTLKSGDHGVPGGENTLRIGSSSVRYFSVRECARLQTFPDEWYFEGSWTAAMRQLGNAVPVELAERVASSLYRLISPQA